MFDKYFSPPPSVASPVLAVIALVPADSTGLPSSTLVDQDAPSLSTSQTPQESQSLVASHSVVEEFHDIKVAHLDNDPSFGVLIPEPNSKESSQGATFAGRTSMDLRMDGSYAGSFSHIWFVSDE
ncbi:hypothetical protein Tco_0976141 [Tanacetum coccineum]|uniref:Dirigent protein n=1 Tax=Tanacetum coccineum TaxID=301880 RepID=A0ABQ5EGD4_9ASTR